MVDCICLMSAVCFLVSNILGVVVIAKDLRKDHFNFDSWTNLDPEYLQEEWNYRTSNSALIQTSFVFNAFAWFLLAVPVCQLAWALSRGGKRRVGVHMAIAGFALGGALAELIARLLVFGSSGVALFIHRRFNLDNWLPDSISNGAEDYMGWRALEVAMIISQGLVLWIDAFEWIALFFVLILLYFSVGTQMNEQRKLDIWWARLGLFIGFLTFVDFAADLLRLEDWRDFMQVAIVISFVNTVLLLPIWLVWLGFSMHTVLPKYDEDLDQWTPGTPTPAGTLPTVENAA